MELSDLLRSLRRHWLAATLAFILVMLAGVAAAYLPEERFTASATVLVEPEAERAQSAVQIMTFVMPSVAARVGSQSFREKALVRVPDEFKGARVKVRATGDPTTGILRIRATSENRAAVADWANAYAVQTVDDPRSETLITVSVLDPAVTPRKPSAPVRPPILLGAGVLGVIAAFFVAIGANALRRRLDNAEEIRQRFGTSVLGEIPRIKRRHVESRPVNLFSGQGSPAVVEAFQQLRTNLEVVLYATQPGAIAITSSAMGEGKSTICANLGWVLASVGHQVTLIDADLRRPALHTYLEQPFGPGLASAAGAELSSLVRSTDLPLLSFVPAGIPDRHPAEVISVNLPVLLERLTGPGRTVLVDCPPLTGVAETASITAMTNHVILVIDARRRDLLDIERALAELRARQAQVLGVVIDRSRQRRARNADSYYHIPVTPPASRRGRGGAAQDADDVLPQPTGARRAGTPPPGPPFGVPRGARPDSGP